MSDAGIISLFAIATYENRLDLGGITLIAYDYILTLDQEIQFIWMRKKTCASLLFLVVRYMAILAIVLLGSVGMTNDRSCVRFILAQGSLQIAQYLPWAVFSGLRALALSGMNWRLATVVFILACGPFIVNVWTISTVPVAATSYPILGCIGGSQESESAVKVLVSISRSCAIAADFLIITITWWRAYRGGDLLRQASRPSLMQVLVVDGTVYFFVLLLLNTLHLIFTMLNIVVSLATVSLISVFIDPITVIVISRFLLALHSANLQSTDEGMSECQDGGGTLRFASEFVESMGGPVTSTVREPEPEVLEGTVLPGIDEETGQTYS